MIVLPDGKICRNLPEQVAENLKKIQEIIHFLDGVNIQDNLVVIADLSQILTAAELEIVERPVAFIYYNAELYIKKNEAAGVAYFVNVFSIEDTGTQLNFNSNEIQVNLGTGALTYSTATATSYSKSQIDSLLALKANDNEVAKLTGAAFTGAITSPSIIEDMSGYTLAGGAVPADFEFIYVGAVKNGNKLTLVWFTKLVATQNSYSGTTLNGIIVPKSLDSVLIPYTLGTLNNLLDNDVIPFFAAFNQKVDANVIIQKYSASTYVNIQPRIYVSGLTIGTTYLFRIEETFLLSDNLAA